MDLLQDISNRPASATTKTFERRRRAPTCEDPPLTPVSAAAGCETPLSSCSSQSCSTAGHDGPLQLTSRSSVLGHRGRRSSILQAAALPGHQQCKEAPASRSILLHKMSKARQKAFLAYTRQMADYYAEVDEFELIEESPGAETVTKTRPRTQQLAGSADTPALPFTHQPTSAAAAGGTVTAAAAAAVAGPNRSSFSLSELSCQSPQSIYSLRGRAASLLAAEHEEPDAAAAGSAGALRRVVCSSSSAATAAGSCAGAESSEEEEHGTAPPGGYDQDTQQQQEKWEQQQSCSLGSATTALHAATPAGMLAATPATVGAAAVPAVRRSSHASPAAPSAVQLPTLHHVVESLDARQSLASCTPSGSNNLNDSEQQQAAGSPADVLLPDLHACSPVDSSSSATGAAEVTGLSELSHQQQQHDDGEEEQLDQHQKQQQRLSDLAAATPEPQQDTKGRGKQQRNQKQPQQPAKQPDAAQRKPSQRQQERKQKQLQQEQELAQQVQQAGEQEQQLLLQQLQQLQLQQQQQPCDQQQLEQQLQQLDDHQVAQLMQQLSAAAAAAQLEALEVAAAATAQLTPLQQMLQACGQSVNLDDIPGMKEFMSDVADIREVVKLGEGTYGEAFKAGGVVFKLVPMEGTNLINGWPQKGAGDLLAEAVIALTLSGLVKEADETGQPFPSHTKAFVKTHRVGVCRGPYPAPFIKAWKAWDKRNKSENDPIEGLPREQLYAVFAMANCGKDLEGYKLAGFEQARCMMLQVALALAVAEDSLAFEHRDLHWGNVMLSPAASQHITARLRGCTVRARTEGAEVCLIDFTASRLQTPGGDVAFCDLELEEGLFDGPKGKPQFETYRRMRKLTGRDWSGSYPGTNVLWLLYLAELLLSSEKPIPGASAAQKRALREFKKRVTGYSCCGEVIWDELFQGLWSVVDG